VDEPILVFLAGSNGAGKSTFFRDFLQPLGLPFINADEIALLLRETAPATEAEDIDRRAFEITEAIRNALLAGRVSFCTETVFSDTGGAKLDFLNSTLSD